MTPLPPGVEHIVDAIYPPARQAIAAQLSALAIAIFFASAALQLALLFGFAWFGLAARLRDTLRSRIGRPALATIAFAAIAYAGYALVLLPLDWYAGFTIPHAYGLSRETPGTWLHDWAVGGALAMLVLMVLALGLAWLVRRFGGRWPLAAVALAAPLIVFVNAIFPAFVAPLFNTYAPLPASPLTASILALAAREGIDASAVYEYDLSRQTTESNAYVSGLGATARIAVGDNLLHDFKPDEVLYVVAHEMGHYVLHHIWWGSLYGWLGAVVAIAFLAWAGGPLVRRAPGGVKGLDDPAAVPLLAGLMLAFSLVTMPASNAVSRSIEHAADAFAASQTQLGDAGVRAFARLGSEGLSVLHPAPLVVWFFYTHPPLDARIAYAASQASTGHGGLTGFPK